MFRGVLCLVGLVVIAGCKKASVNLEGSTWNFNQPGMSMVVSFHDGHFSGPVTAPGLSGTVDGTYHVEGSVLVMDPPTISGPMGSVTPPGGTMRLKMSPKSDELIELDNGSQKFTMTKAK